MQRDAFLDPTCRPETLDRYHIRRSILDALRSILPLMKGTVLDLGCGDMPYRSLFESRDAPVTRYLGLDLADASVPRTGPAPDLTWDGSTIPMKRESIDWAIATEVLEHCPDREAVMREVARVLKPGGRFFATAPFLWPLHEVPHDEARPTPFALRRELAAAGLTVERMESLGGWDQSLAQMIGLWVRRRPMQSRYRVPLGWLAAPLVRLLAHRPWDPEGFGESQMLTGTWFLARKARGGPETTAQPDAP